MTNEEIQEIIAKAEDNYDRLKDRVHEQYDEIKRLKEEYVMLQNAGDEVEEEKDKEIERLHSIIKEVREWAKKYSCQFTNDDGELVVSEISFNIQARSCDLFKILDKENNNDTK